MFLPVWLETWELDCCRPDVAVGELWETTLFSSHRDVVRIGSPNQGWEPIGLGAIRFAGQVVHAAGRDREFALVDLGEIRIGVKGVVDEGWIAGRAELYMVRHGPWSGVRPGEVTTTGIVRRIQRLPIVIRRNGELRRSTDFGPPTDLSTTADRVRDLFDHQDLLLDLQLL